jgi:hypothetical protein
LPSEEGYAITKEYGQERGANDNNHALVGKLAYLHLAIAEKSPVPMWDKSEVCIIGRFGSFPVLNIKQVVEATQVQAYAHTRQTLNSRKGKDLPPMDPVSDQD